MIVAFVLAASLLSLDRLHAIGVDLDSVTYRGHRAVHVLGQRTFNGNQLAIVRGTELTNGVIEADIAGAPARGAPESARGFVGIAFRADADGSHYECFYLRPTNGRAGDQVRRNHSTQYISEPGYDFDRMRKEAPEKYESYVDLVPGEWTHVRIEVDGIKAKLFVNRSPQPVLIVNDLKLGERSGAVALWIGNWTEAWFRDVTVKPNGAP